MSLIGISLTITTIVGIIIIIIAFLGWWALPQLWRIFALMLAAGLGLVFIPVLLVEIINRFGIFLIALTLILFAIFYRGSKRKK